MTKRAKLLYALGCTLIAGIYLCDAFGAHLRSKGTPGPWEWGAAAFWSALAFFSWFQVIRSRPAGASNEKMEPIRSSRLS